MSPRRSIPETVLVTYGLLVGSARAVLPPVWDLPLMRAVRGAMFDQIARSVGVTITAEARRILVDLEQPTSERGAFEQAIRWIVGRFFPGAAVADAARNALRTYGAGALFQRYLETHRSEPRDSVFSGMEAERIRRAMLASLNILSVEHIRAMTRLAQSTFQNAQGHDEASIARRYGDAIVITIVGLPIAWLDVMDESFAKELRPDA